MPAMRPPSTTTAAPTLRSRMTRAASRSDVSAGTVSTLSLVMKSRNVTPMEPSSLLGGRVAQAHLEQQLGVEGIRDPHQRVKLGRPATTLEAGDRRLRGAAQDRELLLAHPPLLPVAGNHAPHIGEAALVIAADRLRSLAEAVAHPLERLAVSRCRWTWGWL